MIRAKISKPMWTVENRKYIEVEIDGKKFTIKVPFRYNKVCCTVIGLTPVSCFEQGDLVDIELTSKIWNGTEYKILKTIRDVSELTRSCYTETE